MVFYWRLEDNGEYSVKSAYNFFQTQKGVWSADDRDCIWRSLWKIKAPPKCLNLVWRVLSKCLPTREQLSLKHVQLSVVCHVCNLETETTMHCLVSCHFAKQCWNILMPDMQWEDETDFSVWLATVLASTSIKKKAEVVTLCWHIWKSRNDLIWNNKPSSVNKVVASTRQYLTQWTIAQS